MSSEIHILVKFQIDTTISNSKNELVSHSNQSMLCEYTLFADSQHPFAVKLEKCRTTSFANTLVSMTSMNWNSLPVSIFPDIPIILITIKSSKSGCINTYASNLSEPKISSLLSIENINILIQELTFYSFPFSSYRGYRNPNRQTESKSWLKMFFFLMNHQLSYSRQIKSFQLELDLLSIRLFFTEMSVFILYKNPISDNF